VRLSVYVKVLALMTMEPPVIVDCSNVAGSDCPFTDTRVYVPTRPSGEVVSVLSQTPAVVRTKSEARAKSVRRMGEGLRVTSSCSSR
jgi:hypothetical protein